MGSFVIKSQQFQDILNAVPLLANQQRNALPSQRKILLLISPSSLKRALFGLQNALIVGRNPFSAGGVGIIASVFGAILAEEP